MSLQIVPILCNAGFMNNYAYLLIEEKAVSRRLSMRRRRHRLLKPVNNIGSNRNIFW